MYAKTNKYKVNFLNMPQKVFDNLVLFSYFPLLFSAGILRFQREEKEITRAEFFYTCFAKKWVMVA